MRRVFAVGVAIAFSITSIPRTRANPALLAPAAFCAGTAGVGCVLLGTILIGGTVYYVWQLSNGHKVRADAHGRVLHSEYLEDPEEEPNASGRPGDSGVWEEPIYAKTYASAKAQCDRIAKKHRAVLLEYPYNPKTKQYRCVFKGGNR